MQRMTRVGVVGFIVTLAVAACAPQPGLRSETSAPAPAAPTFKRISAAIRGAPVSLVQQRTQRAGGIRGLDGMEELAAAGLTYLKADGTRALQLAEEVPSVENGLWKVFPDGRMETTWKIKPNARWHDGTPFTSDDLLFTASVERDKEIEIPPYAEHELIESMSAPDPKTITVVWKKTYIEADALFSYRSAGLPIAKHIMERVLTEDKAGFIGHSYWNEDYVGTGAFKVQEWVRDSHAILRANDDYVFGRPKIDEIEVRFITDNNTIVANVLAGLDLTLGKTISLDAALQARDAWKEGRLAVLPQNWTPINPQFTWPDPVVVLDPRFRRAMLEAIDRQQVADLVFSGQSTIAHSYVPPSDPYYRYLESSVVKYNYDPRSAATTLETLGYTKRADGIYYGADGKQLTLSLYGGAQNDIHPKTIAVVAALWQQFGVPTEQVNIPIQRAGDREYRAHYPSFEIAERRTSLTVSEIYRFHSSQIPMPENRYTAPGYSRYRSPALDAFLERYVSTIPIPERMEALAGLLQEQTSNLAQLPLFYGVDPTMISNRLVNVTARGDAFTQAWNAHEWDIR